MSEAAHARRGNLFHLFNYLGGNVATRGLALISIPVLTRLLSVADYGVATMFAAYAGLGLSIMTLGSTRAVDRYYYEDHDDFSTFFGTTVFATLGVLAVSCTLAFLLRHQLAELLALPLGVMLLLIAIIPFHAIRTLFELVFKARRESRKVAVVQTLTAWGTFGLTVAITLGLDRDRFYGPIIASTALAVALAIYFAIALRPFFRVAFHWPHLRYTIVYAVPLMPYFLGGVILGHVDRIMVGTLSSHEDAGLYSLAYNLGMLLSMVITSIRSAWAPQYFEQMREGDHAGVDGENVDMMRLIVAAAIALIAGGEYLGLLLAHEEFHAGLHVIPPIVIGYVFHGVFVVYGRNIAFAKRTYFASAVTLFAGVVNIALNALLIPRYGYEAAAYTTLASYALMAALSFIVAWKFLDLPFTPLHRVMQPMLWLLPATALHYWLQLSGVPLWLDFVSKGALGGATALWLLRPELRQLLAAISDRR